MLADPLRESSSFLFIFYVSSLLLFMVVRSMNERIRFTGLYRSTRRFIPGHHKKFSIANSLRKLKEYSIFVANRRRIVAVASTLFVDGSYARLGSTVLVMLDKSSALYFTQRLQTSRKIASSGRLSASIDF